jgi:uncharacterized membrane protein
MVTFAVALAVGIIAGLRAMTGAAAAAWAAYLGILPVAGTWLAWLVSPWAVGIVTVFALVELITDQLPSTPSRKVPVQFGTRLVIGAVAGTAFGLAGGSVSHYTAYDDTKVRDFLRDISHNINQILQQLGEVSDR